MGKEECHPGYIAGGMCCLGCRRCRWCGAGCFPWGLISDVLGGVAGGCRARVSLEKKGAKATRQEKIKQLILSMLVGVCADDFLYSHDHSLSSSIQLLAVSHLLCEALLKSFKEEQHLELRCWLYQLQRCPSQNAAGWKLGLVL